MKGISAVADERCRTDKLDVVIKHRSSRETTMVGRGAALDGRLFLGGTDGSNPVPSSGESANHRFLSGGARSPQRAGRRGARKTPLATTLQPIQRYLGSHPFRSQTPPVACDPLTISGDMPPEAKMRHVAHPG